MSAAVDGTLNLSGYNPLDSAWHLKIRLCLSAFQRKEKLERLKTFEQRLRQSLLVSAVLLPTSDQIRVLSDMIDECTNAEDNAFDWQPVATTTSPQQNLALALRAAWSREFGDPDDPTTRQKIAAAAEGLQQIRETGTVT